MDVHRRRGVLEDLMEMINWKRDWRFSTILKDKG